MKDEIFVLSSQVEAAETLARFLVRDIGETLQNRSGYTIALSGGSTPKTLFTVLASKFADSVDWGPVRFFWVDERCVPPSDPESNFRMANELLLSKLHIPSSGIYRILGENDPMEESKRYADEIKKNVPHKEGLPSFDFVLLGMGEDGHTASIFPGSEYLFDSEEICATARHPVSGQYRVTITGKIINNAICIVIFATGGNKSSIINEVLGNSSDKKVYPVSLVSPVHGSLHWFLDRAAAGTGFWKP